jgi:hypothetical protein
MPAVTCGNLLPYAAISMSYDHMQRGELNALVQVSLKKLGMDDVDLPLIY